MAACTATKGFVAHFQPDQINPENSSLQDQVRDITNRLGGKCRFWLASPSLVVDYIQSFKGAMEAAGHKCAGEFGADRIALNLQLASSETPVLHKFDTSGLPSD